MDLYIVRHGETDANKNGVVQGWVDTTLNAKGIKQAKEVAMGFSKPIDAIFSSDLQRASKTASFFREKYPDIPYKEDERLRERNFGDAGGQHRDTYDWEGFWASSEDISTIPNAETLRDFTNRLREFLEYLKTTGYSSVLLVTHGGAINRIKGIIDPTHEHQTHANASVSHLKLRNEML
ncbi:MAG: histidine phosphatase family protein [Candidatus Microsaccharimonas sp.]